MPTVPPRLSGHDVRSNWTIPNTMLSTIEYLDLLESNDWILKQWPPKGLLRKLRAGTTYIEAGNEASNLTLILEGTMNIISKPKDGLIPSIVGTLQPMQFVESPQMGEYGSSTCCMSKKTNKTTATREANPTFSVSFLSTHRIYGIELSGFPLVWKNSCW